MYASSGDCRAFAAAAASSPPLSQPSVAPSAAYCRAAISAHIRDSSRIGAPREAARMGSTAAAAAPGAAPATAAAPGCSPSAAARGANTCATPAPLGRTCDTPGIYRFKRWNQQPWQPRERREMPCTRAPRGPSHRAPAPRAACPAGPLRGRTAAAGRSQAGWGSRCRCTPPPESPPGAQRTQRRRWRGRPPGAAAPPAHPRTSCAHTQDRGRCLELQSGRVLALAKSSKHLAAASSFNQYDSL